MYAKARTIEFLERVPGIGRKAGPNSRSFQKTEAVEHNRNRVRQENSAFPPTLVRLVCVCSGQPSLTCPMFPCTRGFPSPLFGLRSSCTVLPVPGCLTGKDPQPDVFSIFGQSHKAMRVLSPQVNSCGGQSIKVHVGESIEERLDDIRHKVFQRERRVPRIREAKTCLTRGIEVQVLDGNVVSFGN